MKFSIMKKENNIAEHILDYTCTEVSFDFFLYLYWTLIGSMQYVLSEMCTQVAVSCRNVLATGRRYAPDFD